MPTKVGTCLASLSTVHVVVDVVEAVVMKKWMLLAVASVAVVNFMTEIRDDLLFRSSLKFKGVVFRIDDDFKRQVASYGNEIKIDSEDHYRVGVPVKASEIKGLWKVKELVSAEKKRHLYDFIVKPVLLDNFTIGFQGHQGLEFYMKKNPQSHRLELIHLKTKEVIQLVKYVKPQEKKVDVLPVKQEEAVSKVDDAPTGPFNKDMSLELAAVIDPLFERGPLMKDNFEGTVSLRFGALENFEISLRNSHGASKDVSFSFANINDGGQFAFDFDGKTYHGIVMASGKKGFRFRFPTGPLAGAMLSFYEEGSEELENEIKRTSAESLKLKTASQTQALNNRALQNQEVMKSARFRF